MACASGERNLGKPKKTSEELEHLKNRFTSEISRILWLKPDWCLTGGRNATMGALEDTVKVLIHLMCLCPKKEDIPKLQLYWGNDQNP